MNHHFQITALHESEFKHYFEKSDAELSLLGICRMIVDKKPEFPCRVSLEDAEVGEEVILVPYTHHNTDSPYRSSGPIFVRRNATQATPAVNEIPMMLNHRLLSVRAYDKEAMMVEASVVEGNALRETILAFFENRSIEYLHIHNAKPGCYNCAVKRV
jgi:hypothetical protein